MTRFLALLPFLTACGSSLESWNPQHPVTCPKGDCCAPLAHKRGPDAYDRKHHEPFHCESSPVQDDQGSHDVDALEGQP